jgi:hypothetical protein
MGTGISSAPAMVRRRQSRADGVAAQSFWGANANSEGQPTVMKVPVSALSKYESALGGLVKEFCSPKCVRCRLRFVTDPSMY